MDFINICSYLGTIRLLLHHYEIVLEMQKPDGEMERWKDGKMEEVDLARGIK